jgi:hypothetical protein
MKIVFSLFLTILPLLAAHGSQTIKTTDGRIYTNADIIDLCPTGVVVSIDAGVTNIAYNKLPKDLQGRYGYDTSELDKYLKQGLDGVYGPREGLAAFAGVVIELEKDHFTYSTFTDVAGVNHEPLHGRFRLVGNWLIFDDPKLISKPWIVTVIGGRLALLKEFDYWHWKDTGKLDVNDALYRRQTK